jgi:hypothetical protein
VFSRYINPRHQSHSVLWTSYAFGSTEGNEAPIATRHFPMLNYAYAVLAAQTQIRLIAEGFDPNARHDARSLHERGTYPALALDHMEPSRTIFLKRQVAESQEIPVQAFGFNCGTST